jgi:arylsulfatase A-like enzyme
MLHRRLEARDASAISYTAVLLAAIAFGCRPSPPRPATLRLVDQWNPDQLEGSASSATATQKRPRTEWKFDGPVPEKARAAFPATRGFETGPGVAGLAVKDGLLVGRATTAFPILRVERTSGFDDADQLHAVEIRMRASSGSNLSVTTRPAATLELDQEVALERNVPWTIKTPIVPGDRVQTYTMRPPAPLSSPRLRYLLIRPTDAVGSEFAIESVRLVFRREHLADVPSGVSWQGLRDVFRETLVTRSAETIRVPLTLPSRPVLDLAFGTPEERPVTFRISVRRGEVETPLSSHTVTNPHRWERRVLDLTRFAGSSVVLSLSAISDAPGTLAFWGAPVVRQRVDPSAEAKGPRAVILIQGDTLRTDHLDVYGYERPTAPTLRRLAEEGALFQHAITQTSWTKAATPSVLTSLYPSTHGVHQIPDRLPVSATTIAEVFRDAGYATLSFSSVSFTGQFTNLHQGFEELHELESTVGRAGPRGAKTAREYVDRLVEWIDDHDDVPFFIFLHVFDPHSPYEPYRPYDTMWADPKGREEYLRQQEALKKVVKNAFLAQRGMATPDELRQAGVDPEAYLRYSKDWYDGSIRGMDDELGRLVERLQERGLRDKSLLAFYADHGEEFHDHGRMWHGQGVYGEMIRVPLIFWGPGRLAKGTRVEEPVALIDVMPTLIELSGLKAPPGLQGRSLRPLVSPGPGSVAASLGAWEPRPVIAEKQPQGDTEHPSASEAYAIIEKEWKLIHNVIRAPEQPEFELFDFYKDPLDQKNVAAEHPETVGRLAKDLARWREMARAARLPPDSESTKALSAEQLETLRSLGYVK